MPRAVESSDVSRSFLSTKWNALSPLKRLLAIGSLLPVFAVIGLASLEQLTSDAATRLSFQIRNQTMLMKAFGESTRTFRHSPWSWPEGVSGDSKPD